jgi:ABC-type antimicrobial peptide transport system permease subunit
VNDVKFRGVAETAIPILYRALADDDLTTGLSLTARASGDPRAAIVAIREAVQAAAPRLPLASAQTMEERMAMPLWQYRVMAGFFTICGSLALGLAMVGLFGVTYFAVRQRTREFGIRIAIGATSGTVMRQVLGEGARLSLAGSLLGLAGALIAARIIARALVGVSPMDPASFITAALVEGVVAVAACALPARRATQTDPIVALRNE